MENTQHSLYGKTCRGHLAPTAEKISEPSSKCSAKSKPLPFMFLDLTGGGATENGNTQVASWATGIPSLGAYSMRDIGEYPNVVEESFLWQILEANVPQKYYLSAKACRGVLRRAERRGKELPIILKTALEQQIERWEKYGTPLPIFNPLNTDKNLVCFNGTTMSDFAKCLDQTSAKPFCNQGANIVLECYDARGNGDGKTVQTITGDHNNRLTDYTAVVCETYAGNSSGNDIAGTLDSHYYLGCGARGDKEREFSETQYIVRRLTPLECCRLQGMPDWWVNGTAGSDAAQYKMWGNGMALPCALYVMEGIAFALRKQFLEELNALHI